MKIDNGQVVSREDAYNAGCPTGHKLGQYRGRERVWAWSIVFRIELKRSTKLSCLINVRSMRYKLIWSISSLICCERPVLFMAHQLRSCWIVRHRQICFALDSRVTSTQQVHFKRFDGSLTSLADLGTLEAPAHTSESDIINVTCTENQLDAEQDVIFGPLWFREYSTQLDWDSGQVVLRVSPTPVNRKYQSL